MFFSFLIFQLFLQCGHNSQTFKEFAKHSELHTSTCGICKRKFLGITALRNHKKAHEKRPVAVLKEKVPCNICGKLMSSSRLNTHLTQVSILYFCTTYFIFNWFRWLIRFKTIKSYEAAKVLDKSFRFNQLNSRFYFFKSYYYKERT